MLHMQYENAKIEDDSDRIKDYIRQLEDISKLSGADFILSISKDEQDLDPELKDNITVSL